MKSADVLKTHKGSAAVTLLDESTVVCRLVGEIDGTIVEGSMRETKLLAEQARTHGQTKLLLDISGITKQTSEARSKAKDLVEYGFERIAVTGGSRAIIMMGRYIAKAGGMGDYTRFFANERAATAWLKHGDTVAVDDNKFALRSVIALILTIIGVSVLVGWISDVPALRSVVPTFKPMNPMSAVTYLLFAGSILAMNGAWRQNPVRRSIVVFAAGWAIALGASVWIKTLFNVDLKLDSLLFGSQLEGSSAVLSGRITPSAALSLAGVGAMLLLLVTRQRRAWQPWTLYGIATIVSGQAAIVLVAYSFGFEKIYNFNLYQPMAFNSCIALLVMVHAIASLAVHTKPAKVVLKLVDSYWQAIVITLIMVLVTGVAWHQTKQDISKNVDTTSRETFVKVDNSLQSRFSAYSDALNGYKGLFSASDDVAPAEFHSYFVNSGLSTNYPGFLAITYAAVVPDSSKASFTTQTRQRATVDYPKYKNFAMFPVTNSPMHYPLLYVEPSNPTTNYGFDLSTEQVRRQTLEQARDTGKPVASGVINLNASNGSKERNDGFFLSLPIYKTGVADQNLKTEAERRQQVQGFVITYFQNARLFGDIFKNISESDAQFVVSDNETGAQLYKSPAPNVHEGIIKQTNIIDVGGKAWRLSMYVSPQYGRSELYRSLPWAVLFSGIILSGMTGALILAQLRRRDQALMMASRMTEDLSNERNRAVATQQKDEAILSSIGDAVFAIDTNERITLFNQACERISGISAEQAIGKLYADVLKFRFEKNDKINNSFIKQALDGHVTSMKNHTVLLRKDGRSVAVADSAAPIHDARGTLLGAIVVFRDVSKEQELDRAKTEFVSLASHQLRTPLSAINWYGELLLGGDAGKLSKDQHEYVTEIYEGNQRMIDLVNSLLDVSRLDLGKLSNQPSANDMKDIATSLEKELTTLIEGKHLNFRKQIQASLPDVWADPKLLRMIVQNLLSNAVKYTPEKGEVHLTMRAAAESELKAVKLPTSHPYFFMSVSDTGFGIPKAQQAKIFSKLFRADNVRAMDVEGTGLGLYIVKEVVEKLGGRVWFTSIESAGSTFYVILPFKTKAVSSTASGAHVGD